MKKYQKLFFLILILTICASLFVHVERVWAWWDTNFGYRKTHDLTGASGAGTNYPIRIVVHYGSGSDSGADVYCDSHCQTDFDDIRFIDNDDSTALDYWRETYADSNNATFWVEVADDLSSGTVSIYMYYGNNTVSTTSNGTATFLSFESWEGSNDGDTLPIGEFEASNIEGTVEVDDVDSYTGSLSLYADDESGSTQNFATWNYDDKASGGYRFHWAINQTTTSGQDTWAMHFDDGADVMWSIRGDETGGLQYHNDSDWQDITSWSFNAWHTVEACGVVGASSWDCRFDGTWHNNLELRDPASISGFDETRIFFAGDAAYFKGWSDSYFVGKYVDPEPTHSSWGSEETVDSTAPLYQNVGDNSSGSIFEGGGITLYGQGKDETGLDWAWLATNETYSWKNYTDMTCANATTDGTTYWEDSPKTGSAALINVSGTYYGYYLDAGLPDSDGHDIFVRTASIPADPSFDTITWSSLTEVFENDTCSRFDLIYHNGFYLLTTSNGNLTVGFDLYNSTSYDSFTSGDYVGVIIDDSTITDNKYDGSTLCRTKLLYANSGYHAWITCKDSTDLNKRDTLYLNSSTGFTSLTYQGIAIKHGVNANLSAVASATMVWFNTSDSKFHAYVSGSDEGVGDWEYIYHATSSNGLNWTLDGPPPLISRSDFASGSWAYGHLYPPKGCWVNGKYNAIGVGCDYGDPQGGNDPYDHDAQWYISDSPTTMTTENWYTGCFADEYDSPMDMNDAVDTWTWSNYTWHNNSITAGTIVAWKIYYNDTAGNINVTVMQTFNVLSTNNDPTNDACVITNMDDSDNLYAQRLWYLVSYDVTDSDGFADVDYCEVRFKQGGSTRAIFRYDEDTDTFSVESGSSTWSLDGSSSATESGNTINMTFKVQPQWDATEEASLEIECYVVDDEPASDTDTMQSNYFDVVTSVVVSGFSCDDDRGNTGQTITFSGTLHYADDPGSGSATTFTIPDAEITAVHVYNSTDSSMANNSTSSGAFSVSFSAESNPRTETYNCYVNGADADFTDFEDSNTDAFVADDLQIYNLQTVEFLGNAKYRYETQIKYGSDSANIDGAYLNVSLPNGTVLTQLTSNSSGWVTFVLSQSNASQSGTYTIFGVNDNNYGVTVAGANQTFSLYNWTLNTQDVEGNELSSTTITITNGSSTVYNSGDDVIRVPDTSYNVSVAWSGYTVNSTSNIAISSVTSTDFNCTAYPYLIDSTRYWVASNATITSATISSNLLTIKFSGVVNNYTLKASCTQRPVIIYNCTYNMATDWATSLTLAHYGNTTIKIYYSNWGGVYVKYSDKRILSSSWTGEKLTLTTTGATGTIGTLKIFCSGRGAPNEEDGFTTSSYASQVFTGSYTFSSTKSVYVHWTSSSPGIVSGGDTIPQVGFELFLNAIVPQVIEAGTTIDVVLELSWTGTNIIYIYDVKIPSNQSWVSLENLGLPIKASKYSGHTKGTTELLLTVTIPDSVKPGKYNIPVEITVLNELDQDEIIAGYITFEVTGATYNIPEYMTAIFLGVIGLLVLGMVARQKRKRY